MKFILCLVSLAFAANVFAQNIEELILTPYQQATVKVEGCPSTHGQTLAISKNIITAGCALKVCKTRAYGWNGRNQKITQIDLSPSGDSLFVDLKGNDVIVSYFRDLIDKGICSKGIINWVEGMTTIEN